MDTIEKTTHKELVLGDAAVGMIDPAARELDRDKSGQLESDIKGNRFDVLVREGSFLPCGCIDGRCPHDGEVFNPVPNAAGGTLTPFVGELLTTESNLARNASNSEEALASLIAFLQSQGYGDQIGGHTGPSHGSETASGCGANDHLKAILTQIVEKSEVIYSVLGALGVPASEEAFERMVGKAKELTERKDYFVSGKEIAGTLESASPDGNCPELQGAHNEVLIRLNTIEGTTIDRRAIKEAYGDDYQIFNVDVWAIKKAAETLSYTSEEAEEKFAAMVAYQVATALQLCGPSMRVIVR